jgi:hypothetical protein
MLFDLLLRQPRDATFSEGTKRHLGPEYTGASAPSGIGAHQDKIYPCENPSVTQKNIGKKIFRFEPCSEIVCGNGFSSVRLNRLTRAPNTTMADKDLGRRMPGWDQAVRTREAARLR